MIVALSFDADQTLWDFDAVKRRALRATIAEMERRGDVPAGAVTPEAMDQARDVLVQRFRGATHRLEEVRERSFAEVLTAQGHPTPDAAAAVLVEHYMNIRFNQIELFADVAPAIALLKGRYRLGLLAHIGDDWDDIEGANAAGATSIYLNRTGGDPGFRSDADHEVRDLDELVGLLDGELRPQA